MHLKQWRPFQKTSSAPLLPDVPKHSVANGQYLSKFSVRPAHHSPKHQRNRKNKHWTVLGARSTGPTMPETSVGGSSKSRFSHAQSSRRPTHEPLRVQGSSDASKEPQSGPATGFRDLWHCKCRIQKVDRNTWTAEWPGWCGPVRMRNVGLPYRMNQEALNPFSYVSGWQCEDCRCKSQPRSKRNPLPVRSRQETYAHICWG